MTKINIDAGDQKNCLNSFRLLAALAVFYGHAVQHLRIEHTFLPYNKMMAYIPGVPTFFFISGFLIWNSIDRTRDYKTYLKKRVFRIFPELWVAVIVELITIIIFYDKTINWYMLGLFAITQGTVLQFWTPDFLRGYGCGTPNGSLWTMCVIIQFYLFAWFFHDKMKGKSIKIWLSVLVAFMIAGSIRTYASKSVPEIIDKLFSQTLIPYLWLFSIGCFAADKFDILVKFIRRFLPALFVLYVVWPIFPQIDINLSNYALIKSILFFSVCIGIAYTFPKLNVRPDISYGLYIYHMIVINVLIAIGFIGSFLSLLVATIVSVGLGFLSTVTVGKLGLKRKEKYIQEEIK